MKKILIAIGVIIAVILAVLFVIRNFYPDNVAETSADGGKKGLKTRVYKADLASAAKVVEEVIPTLSTWGSSWKLIGNNLAGDSAVVTAEIPVVVFTDDLAVTIKQADSDVTVAIRSASRVGTSDFGENRRHVAQLLEALDKKLGNR